MANAAGKIERFARLHTCPDPTITIFIYMCVYIYEFIPEKYFVNLC